MTRKEKIIAVVIVALLAFGLTLGPAEAQELAPIEGQANQKAFMLDAMEVGSQLDPTPYLTWIQSLLIIKDPEEIQHAGLKFAYCHILWQNAIQEEFYSAEVPRLMFELSAARALRVTQMFVWMGGGDPTRVESILIPGLAQAGVVVSRGTIAECTILDGVAGMVFEGEEVPEPPKIEPEQPKFNS